MGRAPTPFGSKIEGVTVHDSEFIAEEIYQPCRTPDEINASFAEWVLDRAKSRSLSPAEVIFELTKRVVRIRTVSVPLTRFVKAGDRHEVF